MHRTSTRRRFLASLPALAAAAAGLRPDVLRALVSDTPTSPHPDPRPEVDGSKVLTAHQLGDVPDAVQVFEGIREIPRVADGIFCYCGCDTIPGQRSLLTCFEGRNAMAKYCQICQGEARLVIRRHAEGQSLDQIRRAIDARYGRRGGHGHDARHREASRHGTGRHASGHHPGR